MNHLEVRPQDMRWMSFEDRWKLHVKKTRTCWLWLGHLHGGRYGHIRKDGQVRKAHQLAYEMKYGPIPEGLEIDHKCGVPSCVRPSHLEAVTHVENVRRGKGWRTKYPRLHTEREKEMASQQKRINGRWAK